MLLPRKFPSTKIGSALIIAILLSCHQNDIYLATLPDCVQQEPSKTMSALLAQSITILPDSSITISLKERGMVPVLAADKPWESTTLNYACVLRTDGKWQMWYEAFDNDSDFGAHLCYAESQDGIQWTKPDLGKILYNGNRKNNIIFNNVTGMSVFIDLYAPSESKYKLVFVRPNAKDGNWVYGMSSPDGINFSDQVLLLKTYSDTQTGVFFDQNKYRFYVRLWDGGGIYNGRRMIGYTESRDFGGVCTPVPQKILGLDKFYDRDLYNNAIAKIRDDLYVMFPSVFYYNVGTLTPFMASGGDGVNFKLQIEREFLSLGTGFDSKEIFVCPGAIRGEAENEYIFYYLGKPYSHLADLKNLQGSYSGGIGRFVVIIK